MMPLARSLASCSLLWLIGCANIKPVTIVINKNAPANSTQKVVIRKINPVFYSSEIIIVGYDKDNKETHYDVHHEDISIIAGALGAALGVLAGVAVGSL